MSRARRIVLAGDEGYDAVGRALRWVREQESLFECFIRPAARRDVIQNGRWWALCRNLQYAMNSETAMYWHGYLATEVLGVDLETRKSGILVPVPFSTADQEPVEFAQALDSAKRAAFELAPDYFSLHPHETAL